MRMLVFECCVRYTTTTIVYCFRVCFLAGLLSYLLSFVLMCNIQCIYRSHCRAVQVPASQPSMGHRKRYTEEQRRPPFDETTESVCDRYPTPLPTTRLVGDKRYTQPSGSSSQLQRMKTEAEGGLTQWTRARPPSPHPRIIRHKTIISLGLPSPPLTPSNSDTSEPSPSESPPPLPPAPSISAGNNCPLDLDVEWKRSPPKQSYMRPAEPRVAVFRRESRPLRPAHLRYAIVIESD